jgi:hypothetical protein
MEPKKMTDELKHFLDKRRIDYTVAADGALHVGGSLDLQGTQITALPDGLHVGGSLYLQGTQITALPDGLRVGGSLDLQGTQITALPDGLRVEEVLFDGQIGGQTFAVFDGTGSVVLSEKDIGGVLVRHCRKSEFEDGKLTGDKFYVASRDGENAHGETIQEATEQLMFKGGARDVEQYRDMPLDTVKTPSEWALIYRVVTGACQFGTREFVKSKGEMKESYSLAEILEETRGAWGHDQFRSVVSPKAIDA